MSQGEKVFTWETPPEMWRGVKFASPRWQGKVVSLYIAPEPSKPMVALSEVRAFADRGLEGDRFFRDSWLALKRPDKAVSLIEEETLQMAAAELGMEPFGDKARRFQRADRRWIRGAKHEFESHCCRHDRKPFA